MTPEEALDKYFKLTDTHAFFYHGPLSQWWASEFNLNGVYYNCCEQFMMAKKALLFKDQATYEKIMSERGDWSDQADFNKYPRKQKALGRSVEHFDERIWDAHKFDIVVDGNGCRMVQDKLFRETLLLTEDRTLVEASPYDQIWGIGMGMSEPGIEDPENWNGENLLGMALTDVKKMYFGGSFTIQS